MLYQNSWRCRVFQAVGLTLAAIIVLLLLDDGTALKAVHLARNPDGLSAKGDQQRYNMLIDTMFAGSFRSQAFV